MHDLPLSLNTNNPNPERVATREHFFGLRNKLISLKSVAEPNLAAIDAVIMELEQAQLAAKAAYGLFVNNPIDDSTPQTKSSADGQLQTGYVD